MPDAIPTVYTTSGRPTAEDECMVDVRLPADVADELTLVTLWLSIQLGHRLPMAVLRRALILSGIANARRVLVDLRVAITTGHYEHLWHSRR